LTDYPILFSEPMVKALIAGQKDQTRRLYWSGQKSPDRVRESPWVRISIGDLLWVREAFFDNGAGAPLGISHQADLSAEGRKGLKFKPSIHMPRAASRITLQVQKRTTENLQAITRSEAIDEGVFFYGKRPHPHFNNNPRQIFRELWESLHGEGSWDANPLVVAIKFRVILANIDEVKEKLR
jgi:hypothetical protein